jgi:hypothetical protein
MVRNNYNEPNKVTNAPPSSLMDSTLNVKTKTTKGKRIGARSLSCSTSKVEGRAGNSRWD